MRKIVKVRNLEIGTGIPKICVPIVAKTAEEIISVARGLAQIKIDLVEWRVDYYEDVQNIDKVKETLSKLRGNLGELPILFTFRSLKEGGEKEVSIQDYINLNKDVCLSKHVDLIDVELFTGDEVIADIVNHAKKHNVKVVMSNHDFNKTPSQDEIINRLCKMQMLKADLPKIAVMPKNVSDVLVLLSATNEMVTKYANTPIITISMGELGVISRLSGEVFGSSVTFASVKSVSAPGQIEVDKLYKVLNTIHESK